MKLLELEEIKEGLDRYSHSGGYPIEPNEKLRPSSMDPSQFAVYERQLGVVFPEDFKSLLLKYEFDGFLFAGLILFSDSAISKYLDTVASYTLELREEITGLVSKEAVWVASPEYINVLMDCRDGKIYAYDLDLIDDFGVIASSFTLFFRGLGTQLLSDYEGQEANRALNHFIAEAVGSQWNKFWGAP
jgi:hypothetical protein